MSLTVKRERPDQRRHHRVTAPLFVRVEGTQFTARARDWSLGGVRVDGYPGALPAAGSELGLQVTLPFQGFDISFDTKGRILRVNEDTQSYVAEFTSMGEREREVMRHFIEDLVRGVMSPVHDSIQRIDLPVTPVSAEPDPNPKNVVQQRRLPLRQAAWIGIYASLGFVVFGYTALVLYSNLFRMEVQSAVVDAPVLKVLARGDGELPFIRIKAGEKVRQGETVIYFADDDLEKQIDLARIEIEAREAALAGLVRKRDGELARMTQYAAIEVKSIEQSKVEVKALRAEADAAAERVARQRDLFAKGYTTRAKLEDAETWRNTLKGKLDAKRLELNEQKRLAGANAGKFHYTGRELVGEMTEIDAAAAHAKHQVALAHQAHEALLKHRERLSIKAPFDGSVASLPAPEHSTVKRGDILAVFQKDDERWVTAFLTQDEVMKVGLGDTASIYFPALERSVRARVKRIDRTSGFKDEVSRRYSWRGAEDRSAEVRLELLPGAGGAAETNIEAGLPAVVLFEAQSTNPILAAMWRKVSSLFL